MTTFVLEPPCEFINANQRLHYQAKAKLTKAWRVAGELGALDASVGPFDRVHITVTYRFASNRRREVGNLQPTSKAIVDGLVDAGVVADDSDFYVIGPDNRREYPNGPPRVTVDIEVVP